MTHWVTGYGTGGTFHGAGKALKASIPDLKIVLAEPEAAGLLASGVATERNADGSPKASHPAFAAHPIQGWTPDFIPKVPRQCINQIVAACHTRWRGGVVSHRSIQPALPRSRRERTS